MSSAVPSCMRGSSMAGSLAHTSLVGGESAEAKRAYYLRSGQRSARSGGMGPCFALILCRNAANFQGL